MDFRAHVGKMRIARIVLGLKSFARGEAGEPMENTDMRTIIEQTLELRRSRLEATSIRLRVDAQSV